MAKNARRVFVSKNGKKEDVSLSFANERLTREKNTHVRKKMKIFLKSKVKIEEIVLTRGFYYDIIKQVVCMRGRLRKRVASQIYEFFYGKVDV